VELILHIWWNDPRGFGPLSSYHLKLCVAFALEKKILLGIAHQNNKLHHLRENLVRKGYPFLQALLIYLRKSSSEPDGHVWMHCCEYASIVKGLFACGTGFLYVSMLTFCLYIQYRQMTMKKYPTWYNEHSIAWALLKLEPCSLLIWMVTKQSAMNMAYKA